METKKVFKVLLFLLILSFADNFYVLAQFEKKGVLLKNTFFGSKGDTINLYGRRYNSNVSANQYLIWGTEYRYVNENKIKLVEKEYDFWENIWFNYRAADLKKDGWQYLSRVKEDATEFYNQLLQNNLIYYDDFFTDYLYHLVNKIHITKLIKKEPTNFSVVIMKSNEEKYFVFDNGLIVLTTGLIANTKTEKDLVMVLAKCISHIVLEHNIVNIKKQIIAQNRSEFWGGVAAVVSSAAMVYSNTQNNSYFSADEIVLVGASAYLLTKYVLEEVGANYSVVQHRSCKNLAKKYFDENGNLFLTTDHDYQKKISGIVSYTAWQYFHALDYYHSLELVNRIKKENALVAEDYLLLIKLKRLIDSSEKSCYEILSIISTARKNGGSGLIELFKEEAMIFIRLNKKDKAKASLSAYKNGLIRLQENGMNVIPEISSVEQLINRL